MTLRNSVPISWRPVGITDAIDTNLSRRGSMSQLANLIPDPSTLGVFICRPASTLLVDMNALDSGPFSTGFSSGFQRTYLTGTAGNITCLRIFGDRVYGMVSGPGGFDYPFVFNLLTGHLQAVAGGTDTTKLPNTVSTVGAWVPPTIAQVATKVLVTHPGFTGGGPNNLYFGVFDISNPSAIAWTAGNMDPSSSLLFATPPSAVENFNGRAYWAINPPAGQPAAIFSDVLLPTHCANSTQILTFDDQRPLTALVPLPLNNQVTGGIVQSLIVFKGTAQMYQVTGDPALNNLAKNALNVATGTASPLSTAVTPKGIAFISPDGPRIIDFDGKVSDPLGWDGQGKTMPFILSGEPSRVVSAATGTTYRVTVKDTTLFGSPYVEYWMDLVRGMWTGPHTFQPQAIGAWNNTFIISAQGVPGKLWKSDPFVSAASAFVENGNQLTWTYETSFLPDTDQMQENSMIETTITMGMDQSTIYPVQFLDQNNQALASSSIFLPPVGTSSVWGSFVWGAATWGVPPTSLFPRPVYWSAPVVFRKGKFSINGNSSINVKMGALHCRYEQLGYLQQGIAA